jgi:hypothetical protein
MPVRANRRSAKRHSFHCGEGTTNGTNHESRGRWWENVKHMGSPTFRVFRGSPIYGRSGEPRNTRNTRKLSGSLFARHRRDSHPFVRFVVPASGFRWPGLPGSRWLTLLGGVRALHFLPPGLSFMAQRRKRPNLPLRFRRVIRWESGTTTAGSSLPDPKNARFG